MSSSFKASGSLAHSFRLGSFAKGVPHGIIAKKSSPSFPLLPFPALLVPGVFCFASPLLSFGVFGLSGEVERPDFAVGLPPPTPSVLRKEGGLESLDASEEAEDVELLGEELRELGPKTLVLDIRYALRPKKGQLSRTCASGRLPST
mmetsp:Transcript_52843/g.124069  ORF Transcript_52843/g.124069 Transcript_52843/m.124069 type:complete len:147 (+) Transcript_52843:2955-3395(+)